MKQTIVVRARVLSGLFILAALVLIGRLYMLQIMHGDAYVEAAVGQYVEEAPDLEERNDILFTKKDGVEVAAAVMQSGSRIAIQPKALTDPEAVYAALHEITPLDRERFFASAAKRDDPYEEVAFRVGEAQADAIRALALDGVLVVKDKWRRYPGESLGAHLLGFVGYVDETREGVYGLERYYEDTLRHVAAELYVNPFAEIFTNVATTEDDHARDGHVITSIEPNVQTQTERIIRGISETYKTKHVGAIVMDPKSGEIRALAVYPSFDPNTYNTVEDTGVFSNPIVGSIYEMGSIVKPLTVAAGIDSGAITPTTTYNDRGCVSKSGFRFCNFDGEARGVVPMQEVLSQSLNTGVSFIVDKMGNRAFADYLFEFGLAEETGIDLPNEVAGNLAALEGTSDIDFASASFGQSIAVSPIAMIRALSALGNGGMLPQPHIATRIRFAQGGEKVIEPLPPTRVISEEAALTTTRMLVKVFDDALLEGALKEEHYSIAAKTGTAQIADPSCGGYCEGRYLHSFFGYFPAYEPKLIILLYAIEPHGEQYASRTLARPFMELAKYLINYYDIPPDR
jgi:cell division protein FtsI/penicillin-binding protein 2